jgi:hypothetical protein
VAQWDWRAQAAVVGALTFGVVALLCCYPPRTGFIERRRGFLLLMLYAAYLTTGPAICSDVEGSK